VLLFALKKALQKYHFRLYALCIMSNHVHYLLEPVTPSDLPKIMHWLNWYTAMCFNRMLNRTGHFWEKRTSQSAVSPKTTISLCTLHYIHGNPKAAGIKQGFFYDFSNYGTYDQLTTDGLTEWHLAFLASGNSLDECAAKYRGFCKRYKPQPKGKKRSAWGSKMLPVLPKSKPKKSPARGQLVLPGLWEERDNEIEDIAAQFIAANRHPNCATG
jgi:putative transposase